MNVIFLLTLRRKLGTFYSKHSRLYVEPVLVCLFVVSTTLPTTWQGALRAGPTAQTWCGIKQPNRTELANHKETNGSTGTWVFSCHTAVSGRWRGDHAVVTQSVITLRRQRKIKVLITLHSSLWAWPHSLSGQRWLTLKWQWREFTVSAVFCEAAVSETDNQDPSTPWESLHMLMQQHSKLPSLLPNLLSTMPALKENSSSHLSLLLCRGKHWLQRCPMWDQSPDHMVVRSGRRSKSNREKELFSFPGWFCCHIFFFF